MTLQVGTRLGPYEITSPLGAGGMGEVYRARDTRLDRTVAIKVLPAHFADDAERRDRFEREARAVSALSHPHICTLHDVGSQDGVAFLVMELFEGETLQARLRRGSLPPDAVLRFGIEIADALDHAHRRGIVHRDLKPGNVMLTRSGTKLLDFGLASLSNARAGAERPASAESPTETGALTVPGTLLGTLPYMAPEQVEGKPADARADIFALGAVLYEMATGRRAFSAETEASLIGAILHTEPPAISTLEPAAPAGLDRVVRNCLAKDAEARWQSAHDVRLALEAIVAAEGAGTAARPRGREPVVWALSAALLVALLGLGGVVWFRRAERPEVPYRLAVLPPADTILTTAQSPVISPDGRNLVFAATDASGRRQLYLRPLASPEARPLPGTEGGALPFWSPDSLSLGFFAGGRLKRIDLAGGLPQTLCATSEPPRGGTWNREGVILFCPSPRSALYRISARGGEPSALFGGEERAGSRWLPSFLPDGRHYLYMSFERIASAREIRVGSLDGAGSKPLLTSDSSAIYAPPGYLLFRRDAALMAQKFDPAKLELAGEPFRVADPVRAHALTFQTFASVSDNGVLIYEDAGVGQTELVWVDRQGNHVGTASPPGEYSALELSPDDRQVAFSQVDSLKGNHDIYLLDLVQNVSRRFTFDPARDFMPVWSPDGARILFSSNRQGPPALYLKVSTSAGDDEPLLAGSNAFFPTDWSRDGRFIVYNVLDPKTLWDMWALSLERDRRSFPVLQTRHSERAGQLSPDERWLAYTSNESGREEVYVQQFPRGPGRWQISKDGGWQPRWRRAGGELFYLAPDGALMAVETKTSLTFAAGPPRLLFPTRLGEFEEGGVGRSYAVAGDGQRFLLNSLSEQGRAAITVILDWTAALPR